MSDSIPTGGVELLSDDGTGPDPFQFQLLEDMVGETGDALREAVHKSELAQDQENANKQEEAQEKDEAQDDSESTVKGKESVKDTTKGAAPPEAGSDIFEPLGTKPAVGGSEEIAESEIQGEQFQSESDLLFDALNRVGTLESKLRSVERLLEDLEDDASGVGENYTESPVQFETEDECLSDGDEHRWPISVDSDDITKVRVGDARFTRNGIPLTWSDANPAGYIDAIGDIVEPYPTSADCHVLAILERTDVTADQRDPALVPQVVRMYVVDASSYVTFDSEEDDHNGMIVIGSFSTDASDNPLEGTIVQFERQDRDDLQIQPDSEAWYDGSSDTTLRDWFEVRGLADITDNYGRETLEYFTGDVDSPLYGALQIGNVDTCLDANDGTGLLWSPMFLINDYENDTGDPLGVMDWFAYDHTINTRDPHIQSFETVDEDADRLSVKGWGIADLGQVAWSNDLTAVDREIEWHWLNYINKDTVAEAVAAGRDSVISSTDHVRQLERSGENLNFYEDLYTVLEGYSNYEEAAAQTSIDMYGWMDDWWDAGGHSEVLYHVDLVDMPDTAVTSGAAVDHHDERHLVKGEDEDVNYLTALGYGTTGDTIGASRRIVMDLLNCLLYESTGVYPTVDFDECWLDRGNQAEHEPWEILDGTRFLISDDGFTEDGTIAECALQTLGMAYLGKGVWAERHTDLSTPAGSFNNTPDGFDASLGGKGYSAAGNGGVYGYSLATAAHGAEFFEFGGDALEVQLLDGTYAVNASTGKINAEDGYYDNDVPGVDIADWLGGGIGIGTDILPYSIRTTPAGGGPPIEIEVLGRPV